MSCGTTPCPPAAPTPEAIPTWTLPTPASCGVSTVYYNTQQSYVDVCPAGSPTESITVVVLANTYSSSTSQNAADDLALAAAQAQAQALRVITPCSGGGGGGSGDAAFLLAENGDFLQTEDGSFLIL